jgi:hypothetical protein
MTDMAYDKACAAYARSCERAGLIYQQPSRNGSYRTPAGTVVLCNANGTLYRYSMGSDR